MKTWKTAEGKFDGKREGRGGPDGSLGPWLLIRTAFGTPSRLAITLLPALLLATSLSRAWDSPPSAYYSPSTSYQSYYPSYSAPSYYGGFAGGSQSSPIISFELNEQDLLNSSLRVAAREARITDVRDLLRKGGRINSASPEGATALMYASQNCFPEMVEFLLRRGADPSHRDRRGRTALMLAAHDACLSVVKLLLRHGHCAPDARDRSGQSAYDMAENAGELEVDGPAIEIMGLLRSHRPASTGLITATHEQPSARKRQVN